MDLVLTAIALGFLGSFHCIGMCGPIALALPIKSTNKVSKITSALIYNTGRVITYALLGGLFGLLGQSLVIAGFQQGLSITLGVIILFFLVLPSKWTSKFKLTTVIHAQIGKVKQLLIQLFQKKNYSSLFLIGTLNGLLPCGLVYLGIVGAIATGSIQHGSLFMAFFGLGTVPAMLTLSLLGNSISIHFRNKIKKSIPLFIGLMAVLLILRGMNLGIPYVSPQMSESKPECTKCCHK